MWTLFVAHTEEACILQIREELKMRVAFVSFAIVPVAIMYLYFMLRQLREPWGMKHHARFAGELRSLQIKLNIHSSALACPMSLLQGYMFKYLLLPFLTICIAA